MTHLRQHDRDQFDIFGFVGLGAGLVVIIGGAGKVVEVERKPSGQARGVAQRGKQRRPQRVRALRQQRAHQILLGQHDAEDTARAERP